MPLPWRHPTLQVVHQPGAHRGKVWCPRWASPLCLLPGSQESHPSGSSMAKSHCTFLGPGWLPPALNWDSPAGLPLGLQGTLTIWW